MPELNRRWIVAPRSPGAEELSRALGISPLVADLLWQRGQHTPELASQFLDPRLQGLSDPFLLTGLKPAVERIERAIARKERIAIYGDYDVDGITSSALLWRILTRLGATVETFLPQRMGEGYGLSLDGLERCLAEHHPELLIAVDCGTTSTREVAWLKERGIDALVLDHHTLPEELPACHALVNPRQDGHSEYLASVGVVFKVCHGLLKLRGADARGVDLKEYLDLVAVGTVADLVPLVEENRIFVRRGLQQLAQTHNAGLKALLQVCQIRGVPGPSDVGFRIGPRLNASGRLGDAMRSLELLKTEDAAVAQRLARELDASNRERQTVEQAILEEAEKEADAIFQPDRDAAVVVGKRGWHVGVIGIVASRIQKRHHRPTIVIGFDENGLGKGSGRSIEGCSIVNGLRHCAELLEACGGHDMAAGLTVREDNLVRFRELFNTWVRANVAAEYWEPVLRLSAELGVKEVGQALYEEIEQLAPFGQQNPQPLFAFRDVRAKSGFNRFGRNHVKFSLAGCRSECEAVGFGMGERAIPGGPFAAAGSLEWDDYRGRVQVRLADWRASW